MVVLSPASAAQEEIMAMLNSPAFAVGFPKDILQLQELWEIDCQAYNNCLSLDEFSVWWKQYKEGSVCLLVKGRIVASVGIYPISSEDADNLASGMIREKDLIPLTDGSCVRNWYVSGCVIIPEHQNKGLLRPLLRIGFGRLLSSNLPDEVRLLSLGETPLGCKILRRTGFHSVKPASQMPDGSELYERICTSDQLRQTVAGF